LNIELHSTHSRIGEAQNHYLYLHAVSRLRVMLCIDALASGTNVPHEVPELAQDAPASDAPASGAQRLSVK